MRGRVSREFEHLGHFHREAFQPQEGLGEDLPAHRIVGDRMGRYVSITAAFLERTPLVQRSHPKEMVGYSMAFIELGA